MSDRPMNLNAETHRLTDIKGTRHPLFCQSCGRRSQDLPLDKPLGYWQEHDHKDQPEHRLLALCVACSKKLIEPHPRLYMTLGKNTPWPGCMAICIACVHRRGVDCGHPAAKRNGGGGVMIKVKKPAAAFVDAVRGGKREGWLEKIYFEPASGCQQREAVKPTEAERAEYAEILKRIEASGNDGPDVDEFQEFCRSVERKYNYIPAEELFK